MPRMPKVTDIKFVKGVGSKPSGFATSTTRIFDLKRMYSGTGTKSSRRPIRIWKK